MKGITIPLIDKKPRSELYQQKLTSTGRHARTITIRTIHDNVNLGKIQKMQYLKTHTKGEPGQMIKHFITSVDNYDTAWEILNARYQNERKIVNTYFNTIKNHPKVQSDNAMALR